MTYKMLTTYAAYVATLLFLVYVCSRVRRLGLDFLLEPALRAITALEKHAAAGL